MYSVQYYYQTPTNEPMVLLGYVEQQLILAEAVGMSTGVMAHVKECYEQCNVVDEVVHNKLNDLIHLYQLTFDEDERISTNALWVFTHFDMQNNEWLYG